MKGVLTLREEWLYPDTQLGALPNQLIMVAARNGRRGIQGLIGSEKESIQIEIEGDVVSECFEMLPIPVEYNTVSDEEQGGHFVQMDTTLPLPTGCTRQAPFDVYDCLKPAPTYTISPNKGRCAFYLTLKPTHEGTEHVKVRLIEGKEVHFSK